MRGALIAVLVVCFFALWTPGAADKPTIAKLRAGTFYRLMQSHPSVVILACHESSEDCQAGWTILRDLVDNLDSIPGLDDIKFGYYPTNPEDAEIIRRFGLFNGELNYVQNVKLRQKMPVSKMTDVDAVIKFLQLGSLDTVQEYTSAEQFQEEVKSCAGELSTIVYFAEGHNEGVENELLKIFHQYPDIFQVGAVRDPKLITALEAYPGQVKVYQCYDHSLNKEFSYDVYEDVKVDHMRNWILHHGTPLVAKATRDTVHRAVELFGECIVVALPDDQMDLQDMLLRVAKKLQGNVGFVWDHVEARKQHFIDVGATGTVWPSALGIINLQEPPVVWDEKMPFTEENLLKWAKDVEKKQAETFRKSAPIPEPQPNERVQALVYENFMSTIQQKDDRAKLVLFYGPYERCADCYSTGVAFKTLAEQQRKSYPVDFYTYDVSQNYAAQKITRLPELYLYRGDSIFRFPDRSFSPKSLLSWLHEEMGVPRPVHDEL